MSNEEVYMIIQITRSGTVSSSSAEDLDRMRSEFDRQHCIRIPELLEPGLLQLIQRRIDRAEFSEKIHKRSDLELICVESCLRDNTLLGLLHFLANDPRLFQIIQQITGCGQIGCFTGRVYRKIPGRGHYDSWHNDMADHRMIGMSINLSMEVYSGGLLQIRDRGSKQVICEVANIGFGDGIIFRIASHLEHQVTDVEGTVAKTAFAGWFQSQPDYQSFLKKRFFQPKESVHGERAVMAEKADSEKEYEDDANHDAQ